MLRIQLLKKEITEFIKTPKGLILGILFIFFAIASPALAKYMNEILAAVATDIVITFPDPTLKDAWLQFYKNMNTICVIVYLIVMTGTISQEKQKGSILLILTKKVTRTQVLFNKFIAGILVFTVLLAVSALFGGLYTYNLFGDYFYDGLGFSLLILWLMGIFFTSLAVLVSVLGKTPTTSALLGFFGFAIFQILNISNNMALFNPAGASSLVNGILADTIADEKLWIAIVSPIVASVLLLGISNWVFKKQEI
jgi:ABC-2 type transport system permease protein